MSAADAKGAHERQYIYLVHKMAFFHCTNLRDNFITNISFDMVYSVYNSTQEYVCFKSACRKLEKKIQIKNERKSNKNQIKTTAK